MLLWMAGCLAQAGHGASLAGRIRGTSRQLCHADFADLAHQSLQDPNALGKQAELFGADIVMRRIARIDIGAAEKFETALLDLRLPRPGLDQLGCQALSRERRNLACGSGAVERQTQKDAVVKALSGCWNSKAALFDQLPPREMWPRPVSIY